MKKPEKFNIPPTVCQYYIPIISMNKLFETAINNRPLTRW